MYADHVPIINAAMRDNLVTFRRGVMFAVLSARTQFYRMPEQVACLDANGRGSPTLWTWKWRTFDYMDQEETAVPFWRAVCAADNSVDGLRAAIQCPGLGLVKGAFVLQMLGHDIACIDSRNADRDGHKPNAFNLHGRNTGKWVERMIERY